MLALTFMLPLDALPAAARPGIARAMEGARTSGTPFVCVYRPDEIVDLARAAGFREARHVSSVVLSERFFRHRSDGLGMATAEEFLLAST